MEYIIKGLVNSEPKVWQSPQGNKVYYIEVELEEHDKIVAIGKMAPDALKKGDKVYGAIIPTDYLADKFKPAKPPESSSKSEWKPKDEKQITKNMVWKNLLQHFDVPSMEYGSEQWETFWGLVELHTDMLLPTDKKPPYVPQKPSQEPLPEYTDDDK